MLNESKKVFTYNFRMLHAKQYFSLNYYSLMCLIFATGIRALAKANSEYLWKNNYKPSTPEREKVLDLQALARMDSLESVTSFSSDLSLDSGLESLAVESTFREKQSKFTMESRKLCNRSVLCAYKSKNSSLDESKSSSKAPQSHRLSRKIASFDESFVDLRNQDAKVDALRISKEKTAGEMINRGPDKSALSALGKDISEEENSSNISSEQCSQGGKLHSLSSKEPLGNNLEAKEFSSQVPNPALSSPPAESLSLPSSHSIPAVHKLNGLVMNDEIREELSAAASVTSQAYTNIRAGNTGE